MTGKERRALVRAKLLQSETPLTGASLATEMGVSRQVIVADIALLRTAGATIYATPEGYVMPATPLKGVSRVIAAKHLGWKDMREEMVTVVNLGGCMVDVSIEHKIYGEFHSMMLIRDIDGVDAFLFNMRQSGMEPMSALTGGVHLHTITAPDEATLDAIETALRLKGLLVETD